jgi:hypothetical protein
MEPRYKLISSIIKAADIVPLLYSATNILIKILIGIRDGQNRTIPIHFSSGSSLTGRERKTYKIQRIMAGINPNHL